MLTNPQALRKEGSTGRAQAGDRNSAQCAKPCEGRDNVRTETTRTHHRKLTPYFYVLSTSGRKWSYKREREKFERVLAVFPTAMLFEGVFIPRRHKRVCMCLSTPPPPPATLAPPTPPSPPPLLPAYPMLFFHRMFWVWLLAIPYALHADSRGGGASPPPPPQMLNKSCHATSRHTRSKREVKRQNKTAMASAHTSYFFAPCPSPHPPTHPPTHTSHVTIFFYKCVLTYLCRPIIT